MRASVYDVFDNFLGEEGCRNALRLSDTEWDALVLELRAFYGSWEPPASNSVAVFPGSWVAHNFDTGHGRSLVGNDLLLFDRVLLHDPIEPLVSKFSRWTPPPGAPELSPGQTPLALTLVPPRNSRSLPQLTTALFPPHVPAFMTVTEAYAFNAPWSSPAFARALDTLDRWRDLVEMGAIELAPAVEITAWQTPSIARWAEASIKRVEAALGAGGGHALTSFSVRGAALTPGWQSAATSARANARHTAWVYAREVAFANQGASLAAAEHAIDQAVLSAIRPGEIAFPSPDLALTSSVAIPGFSDVALSDIVAIRRDVPAFAEVRSKLGDILRRAPADLAALSTQRRSEYLREHLNDEIEALTTSVAELGRGSLRRFSSDFVRIVVAASGGSIQGGTRSAIGAAVAALAPAVSREIGHRRSVQARSTSWIVRNVKDAVR